MEYPMMCPDCNHDYPTCISHNKTTRKRIPDPDLVYKLNNYGFRSDDFSIENTKNNFLFSGCSHTFGTGVPYSMTWAYYFNNFFKKDKLLNLGVGANNVQISISNVFEYIKKFGNPAGIFILLPDYKRTASFNYNIDYHLKENSGRYIQTLGDIGLTIDQQRLNLYTYMNSLEMYCKTSGIPLIWGSWDYFTSMDINEYSFAFENYVDASPDNLNFNVLSDVKKELLESPYWHKSRDPFHFGGKIHYMIAHRFKEKWDELYG